MWTVPCAPCNMKNISTGSATHKHHAVFCVTPVYCVLMQDSNTIIALLCFAGVHKTQVCTYICLISCIVVHLLYVVRSFVHFSIAELLLSPQSLTVFVGENATFDCVGPEGVTSYQWRAYSNDGSIISITNISILEDQFSYHTYTNVQLNTIHKVECIALVENLSMDNDTEIHSDNVTLKVIGKYHICMFVV